MRRACFALCSLALVTSSSACGSCARSTPSPAQPDAAPVASQVASADSGVAPPRCTVDRSLTLDADGEIGEAAASATGFAVGLTRKVQGQRVASIALVPEDLAEAAYVDLGVAYGDDPAPRPFSRGADVLVGRYARSREGGAARELELYRVTGKAAQRALSIAQPLDDSFAFDVALSDAGGVVVWDEDGPRGRGAIQAALLEPSLDKIAAPVVISPDASDAEAPRVVARLGGYWAVWVARKPESVADASDDAHALEGPGEVRTFDWLEAVALDDKGKPVGDVRKLTPATGHVALFDLAVVGAELDVVYRDDAEATEGAGGRILRVVARDNGVQPPVELVKANAGRGAPDLIGGLGGWLSFVDTADRSVVVPLGKTRDPAGLPSEEPQLHGGRVLVASRKEGGGLLAGAPPEAKGEKSSLRKLVCKR